MRRILRILAAICCVGLLSIPVFADNSAPAADVRITVTADGVCQVAETVNIHLDSPAAQPVILLPAGAKGTTVNGVSVRTYPSPNAANVYQADLSHMKGVVGDFTVSVQYSLSDVLQTVNKKLCLNLPLFAGYEYAVQGLGFSVTLPTPAANKPTFASSYQQSSVESIMDFSVVGNLISGRVTSPLQDREALAMTLEVDEEMFPGKLIIQREGTPELIPMGIFAALALVYWLAFLRNVPLLPKPWHDALDGMTAGELGSRLTLAGVDMTMMVFSWASLGYLRISPDSRGRVRLIRRMDMGNERSQFENRYFKALFSRGDVVDATGTPYAKLAQKVSKVSTSGAEIQGFLGGNTLIFRALFCIGNFFCGWCYAMSMPMTMLLQTLLAVGLGIVGCVAAWGMQAIGYRMFLRGKQPAVIGAVCAVVWMIPAIISGQVSIGLGAVAAQIAAGFFAAYGGRRSSMGQYQASQILGLRRYLLRMPKAEVDRRMQQNPDFFFEMMPYALALGVDRQFAAKFTGMQLPPCAYLTARDNPRRTAQEWAAILRRTADRMDLRLRRLEREKWTIVSIHRG